MDTLGLDKLAQLTAGGLIVTALFLFYLMRKVDTDAQKAITSASSSAILQSAQASASAFTEVVRTLRDSLEGQRLFYNTKIDDMRGEVQGLRAEVRQLEEDNERKNRRIEELERENERLTNEVDQLRKQLDGKEPRKKAKKETPIETTRAIGAGARVPAVK